MSTFRAKKRISGVIHNGDYIWATFTIERVTKAGIVYANGVTDETTQMGRPWTGMKRWTARFKNGTQFQSGMDRCWFIPKETTP